MRDCGICLALSALLTACLFLAGCGRKPEYPLPPDGVSRFPTGEPLREGDVILARSYGLIGAMFANHSQSGGQYSHGAMIYRDDNGRLMMLNYRPTGMETCTPEEFFSRYYRLGLVRFAGDWNEARAPDYLKQPSLTGLDALSATAKHWLRKDAEKRIPPDYHLDHDEHSAMFCLELASTVYRDCGLPDPFHRARKANEDPLLILANKLFKADVYEIRSPSSVLDNPRFTLVDTWERPEFDRREEVLNEEVIQVLVEDLYAGLRPRRPKMMGRAKLRQIFLIYHVVTKGMFWRPKQDLPDFIDTEVVENGYMMYCYASRSKKAAKKRMLAETPPVYGANADPETLERVRRMVREECAKRRSTYLSEWGRARVQTQTTMSCR